MNSPSVCLSVCLSVCFSFLVLCLALEEAIFGRLGSLSDPMDLVEDSAESEEDWEDLDNI